MAKKSVNWPQRPAKNLFWQIKKRVSLKFSLIHVSKVSAHFEISWRKYSESQYVWWSRSKHLLSVGSRKLKPLKKVDKR